MQKKKTMTTDAADNIDYEWREQYRRRIASFGVVFVVVEQKM